MKSGRELDALVAEKVFGEKCICNDSPYCCQVHDNQDEYSTNIAAAWEVLNKHDCFELIKNASGHYICTLVEEQKEVAAESAPHAICLAALKAVGVEL